MAELEITPLATGYSWAHVWTEDFPYNVTWTQAGTFSDGFDTQTFSSTFTDAARPWYYYEPQPVVNPLTNVALLDTTTPIVAPGSIRLQYGHIVGGPRNDGVAMRVRDAWAPTSGIYAAHSGKMSFLLRVETPPINAGATGVHLIGTQWLPGNAAAQLDVDMAMYFFLEIPVNTGLITGWRFGVFQISDIYGRGFGNVLTGTFPSPIPVGTVCALEVECHGENVNAQFQDHTVRFGVGTNPSAMPLVVNYRWIIGDVEPVSFPSGSSFSMPARLAYVYGFPSGHGTAATGTCVVTLDQASMTWSNHNAAADQYNVAPHWRTIRSANVLGMAHMLDPFTPIQGSASLRLRRNHRYDFWLGVQPSLLPVGLNSTHLIRINWNQAGYQPVFYGRLRMLVRPTVSAGTRLTKIGLWCLLNNDDFLDSVGARAYGLLYVLDQASAAWTTLQLVYFSQGCRNAPTLLTEVSIPTAALGTTVAMELTWLFDQVGNTLELRGALGSALDYSNLSVRVTWQGQAGYPVAGGGWAPFSFSRGEGPVVIFDFDGAAGDFDFDMDSVTLSRGTPIVLPECPTCAGFESFHDVVLDPYISYGCKIHVKFQTFLTKMRQGHEERIGEWQDPIWTFDITPALRDQADLDYLLAFFRARQGPLHIFKFLNPLDYQVEYEVFGYGDGTTTMFQLSRHYDTGIAGDTPYYVRPISLPAAGAQVYTAGVLVEEGLYVVCPLGGTVIFATPPASGAALTWSGMYYTPVRFLNGRVYSTVEHYQHYEDQIMLVEERIPPCAPVLVEQESPDFVEVCFPDRYAQRAAMGPEIDVITISSDSGGTFRQLQFQSAKIRFTVEETEQPQAVVASLLAFFLNRKGRLYGFRAKDITDFSLNQGGGVLETADGTRTQFQLVKRYTSAAQTSVRTILKPNSDVIVDVGGTPADPQPTVSTATGIITFATPPAAGTPITCSGTFDVPVRFNADEAVFSIQGFEAFNMESMTLLETELGLPTFAIESATPALMAVEAQTQAVPMPRLALPGQQSCALPPRPAVTQYLEFRGGTTGSGAGTYSGLEVERPGSMYKLLAGASSLTVAFLVSHVKSGTPSGALGAVYPMSLFSHVMPGMGTDPTLYPSTGFTLYLANYGAGIALDVSLGAYKYATSGALCVPQLNLTPRVPAQGAVSASAITDNNSMHAYVVTFDWVSHRAYWSGTLYGVQEFSPEAFVYNTCFTGTGGADARLLEATAAKYLGSRDLTIGQGETANDGWLGVVGQAPQTPAFHSPLSAFVYEHLFLPTFTRVDMQRMLRDVHAPILRYWGSKYSTGYANVQSPVAPGFDLFWWRADENVSIADTPTGAIAAWAPVVCGFQWMKANSTVMSDEGQPRRHAITTMPALSDVFMLADGRRLLARQT